MCPKDNHAKPDEKFVRYLGYLNPYEFVGSAKPAALVDIGPDWRAYPWQRDMEEYAKRNGRNVDKRKIDAYAEAIELARTDMDAIHRKFDKWERAKANSNNQKTAPAPKAPPAKKQKTAAEPKQEHRGKEKRRIETTERTDWTDEEVAALRRAVRKHGFYNGVGKFNVSWTAIKQDPDFTTSLGSRNERMLRSKTKTIPNFFSEYTTTRYTTSAPSTTTKKGAKRAKTDKTKNAVLDVSDELELPETLTAWCAGRTPKVVVIGAGPAGLSSASALIKMGVDVTVLEGRDRIGGRVHTETMKAHPEHGLPEINLDLGASFVHGCNKYNPAYVIAQQKGAVLDTAEGGYSQGWGGNAHWYDAKLGGKVKQKSVQKGFNAHIGVVKGLLQAPVPTTEAEARAWIDEEYKDGDNATIALKAARAGLSLTEYQRREVEREIERKASAAEGAAVPVDPDDVARGLWTNPHEWGTLDAQTTGEVRWATADIERERVEFLSEKANDRRDCSIAASLSRIYDKLYRGRLNSTEECVYESFRVLHSGYNAGLRAVSTRYKVNIEKEDLERNNEEEEAAKRALGKEEANAAEREAREAKRAEEEEKRRVAAKKERANAAAAAKAAAAKAAVAKHTGKSAPYDDGLGPPTDFKRILEITPQELMDTEPEGPMGNDMRHVTGPVWVRAKRRAGTGQKHWDANYFLWRKEGKTFHKLTFEDCGRVGEFVPGVFQRELRSKTAVHLFMERMEDKRKKERAKAKAKATKEANAKAKPELAVAAPDTPSPAATTKRKREQEVEEKEEEDDEDEDLDYSDGLVVGGYHDLVVATAAEGVPSERIRLDTPAASVIVRETDVKTDADGKYRCVVTSKTGEEFECDYVVVALPLGVLQGRAERSNVTFAPPLSHRKRAAIASLGMGVENKVVLRFERCFWPAKIRFLNCTDQRYRFINMHAYGKPNTIVAHVGPPFCEGFADMSDEQVRDDVIEILRKMMKSIIGNQPTPTLLDWRVTRWSEDVWSCGAYSYMRVGSDEDDVLALAEPEHNGRVYFAGEACTVEGAQCVHGAVWTGNRAAVDIAAAAGATPTMDVLLGGEVAGLPYAFPIDFHWVGCKNKGCGKWRRLPSSVDPETLPDDWCCYNCDWHAGLQRDGCGAPQEPPGPNDDFGALKWENWSDAPAAKLDRALEWNAWVRRGEGVFPEEEDLVKPELAPAPAPRPAERVNVVMSAIQAIEPKREDDGRTATCWRPSARDTTLDTVMPEEEFWRRHGEEAQFATSPGFQSPGVPFHAALPAAPAPHFPPQVSPFDPRVAHLLAMQAEQQARNSLSESYSYQAYAQQASAQLASYNQVSMLRTAATGAGGPLPGLVPQHARRMPAPAPPPEMDMLTTRLLSSSAQFGLPTVADPATEEKTGMAIMGLVNRDRNM